MAKACHKQDRVLNFIVTLMINIIKMLNNSRQIYKLLTFNYGETYEYFKKVKLAYPISQGLQALSNRSIFYFPIDGMLVHCRVTPNFNFASTYLYTLVKRGNKVSCLDTMLALS